jgi:hypothetical protein
MNQFHRVVALKPRQCPPIEIDPDVAQRRWLAALIAPPPRCVSTYVSCGGIIAMIAWHKPDVAFDPK